MVIIYRYSRELRPCVQTYLHEYHSVMFILLLYGEKCQDKKVEEQKDVAVSSAKPVFLNILIQKASYNLKK